MLVTNVNLHAETKEALKTCFITGLGHSGPMMQLPGMGDRLHPGTHKRPEHEVEVGTCSDELLILEDRLWSYERPQGGS